jgi:hypothetical protein
MRLKTEFLGGSVDREPKWKSQVKKMEETTLNKPERFCMAVGLLICAMLSAGPAQASVATFFGDQPGFLAEGTITQFQNFSSCPVGICNLSNPVTLSDVTYTTGDNLIVGTSGYGNSVPVFVYDNWTPITGTINSAPQYDMFGFNLGVLGSNSPVTLSISTNLATYTFASLSVPNVSTGMTFEGFVASSGEYFTSFNISADLGSEHAPAITDVSLGNAAGVPEPSTVLLLSSGVAGLLAWRKKKAA